MKKMRKKRVKQTLSIVITAAMVGTTYVPVAAEGTQDAQVATVENAANQNTNESTDQNTGTANETATADAATGNEDTAKSNGTDVNEGASKAATAVQTEESQDATTSDAVAKIGETQYTSLQEAIDAAGIGDTVVVTSDVSVTGALTIAADKQIVLDLNGKTVTVTNTSQRQISVSGELTIKDSVGGGVLTSAYAKSAVQLICILDNGKVTLESGTLSSKTSYSGSSVYVAKGTFSMTGGSVEKSDVKPSNAIYLWGKECFLELSGGSVECQSNSGSYAIKAASKSVIKITENPIVNGIVDISTPELGTITGGSYDRVLTKLSYLGDGYSMAKNEDGRYTVISGCEAVVGTADTGYASYATLQEALDNAKSGDTVTLRQNIDNFAGTVIKKDLTIDFGKYTVTGAKGAVVLKVQSANVTLQSTEKTGGINGGEGGNNIAVWASKDANVTINSGTYTVGGDADGDANSTVYVTNNGNVTINGGTFSSEKPYKQNGKYYVLNLQNDSTGSISIKGGSFENFDPIKGDDNLGGNFVAQSAGVDCATSGDSKIYTVKADQPVQIVDEDGNSVKSYAKSSFSRAFNEIKSGQKIILSGDVSPTSTATVNAKKNITLDLNGYNINFTKSPYSINVTSGSLNIEGKGTITSVVPANRGATICVTGSDTDVENYSVVNIGKDVTIVNTNPIGYGLGVLQKGSSAASYGVKLTLDGKVVAPYGITVNGLITQQTGNIPEITINGEIESTSEADSGSFYAAGYAKYNINGKLTGVEFAFEIRAGILNIDENAVLTATGDFKDPISNGNGSTVQGAALAISQHSTNLPIKVNVAGGTFSATGKGGHSLYEIDTVKGDVYSENVIVNVTGGTFNQPIFSANNKFAVAGGTFSEPVKEEYCAEGYVPAANEDGIYTVEKADVVKIDNKGYKSLEDAFKAAKAGDTITLVRDVALDASKTTANDQLMINKDCTIDLAGHTITNPYELEPTANWSAFWIKGCTVTIKDSSENGSGKIQSGDAENMGTYLFDVIKGGTLNIESGTYFGGGTVVQVENGTANVTGGRFAVKSFGGQYNYDYMFNCIDAAYKNGTASIVIKGGTFENFNPASCKAEGEGTSFVAEEYESVDNGDGTYTVQKEKGYQVSVQSRIERTDNTIANVSGGGADITTSKGTELKATVVAGYEFLGWYEGYTTENSGTLVSKERSFTYKPTGDVTLTAVYRAKEESFKLKVTGSKFTINDGTESEDEAIQDFNAGKSIKVKFTAENQNFLYWKNESGKILSKDKEYTFVLGSNTTIHAVTSEKNISEENTVFVVFLSAYQQIMSAGTYRLDEIVDDVYPDAPYKMGYEFVKWDKTVDEIKEAVGTTDQVIVTPIYQAKENSQYTIQVKYEGVKKESETYTLQAGDSKLVTAPTVEGKEFQYWKKGNEILSYQPSITVWGVENIELTAVYAGDKIDKVTTVNIIGKTAEYDKTSNKYKMTFIQNFALADSDTIVQTGFVYTTEKTLATDAALVLDGTDVRKAVSSLKTKEGSYSFTARTPDPEKTVYIRAFVQYKDNNGYLQTKYTDIVDASYKSIKGGN